MKYGNNRFFIEKNEEKAKANEGEKHRERQSE